MSVNDISKNALLKYLERLSAHQRILSFFQILEQLCPTLN